MEKAKKVSITFYGIIIGLFLITGFVNINKSWGGPTFIFLAVLFMVFAAMDFLSRGKLQKKAVANSTVSKNTPSGNKKKKKKRK
ncbi:hypothetical protein CSC2_43150 [Clostridium zeae]|uniref:Uncharacterized protein n=1 Tax=Clostridium zeae TaxID=2759022 RepID=A0ABQ1EGH6_9CLOT|nr:hypothetical protein [Clostridium zeae]GFZ33789.1 hypothetical protein CSC2_43150 [Clostridium zeae]